MSAARRSASSAPAERTREHVLAFGSFRLCPQQKMLLEDSRPVRIGSRALDLLVALVERAGEIVAKHELIACAWPDSAVEENNLRVHIAAIRKRLGDGRRGARYIINVAGRGYSFVAPVARVTAGAEAPRFEQHPAQCLPALLTRPIGREEAAREVSDLIAARRLVTLVGPAGIGKTTVSLAVARHQNEADRRQVSFVDLAAVAAAELVPTLVAAGLGIPTPTQDAIGAISFHLQYGSTLLVLDNCEHVIECVARLVERIPHAAPGVSILATSRERLQAKGEYVYSLPPLQSAPAWPTPSAEEAMRYSAVQLFVERAVSALDSFEITDRNAGQLASICSRLDCIPLAIELVAARIAMISLDAIDRSLEGRLLLACKGRRTAAYRHQSLSAALDWSFQLLTPTEQAVLRRLAAFRGPFSAESASAIAAEAAEIALQDAPVSVCQALGLASCPIALWRGDYQAAGEMIARLRDHSQRHGFTRWHRLAQCLEHSLAVMTGEHIRADHRGDDLQTIHVSPLQRDLLATISDCWVDGATMLRANLGHSGWCTAELLRVVGDLQLCDGGTAAADTAEGRYWAALQYARHGRALAWELRIVMSLAQLWLGQGRRREAVELLGPRLREIQAGAQHTGSACRASVAGAGVMSRPGAKAVEEISGELRIDADAQALCFGSFKLFPAQKVLLENGKRVQLGSRAIELLIVLVERAGEIVRKNELIARVWPHTFVEDNNLRVHITAIRKRLGDCETGVRYIVNVAGRGYSFVAAVSKSSGAKLEEAPAPKRQRSLPTPISRPIGRRMR